MDFEAKKICIYMKKGVVFSVRICYTTAHDYPFVVGVALFSFLLYKLFPSLFGFLVSSSPVIFCTAALLGILLSFGEPNIPEVEGEEKSTHDISSLKAAGVSHDHVIEKDESFTMEALVERRTDEGSDGSVLHSAVCEAEEVKNADSLSRSIAVAGDTEVIHGMAEPVEETEFHDHVIFEKKEFHDDGHATDDGKDTAGPEMEPVLTAGGVLEARLDGRDDESSDSSSDRAESSSPDASMADVMPMLDELHPLLESEAPQPALIFLDDSETESDDDSAELLGDADNLDEEETHEYQKDGSEAVVKWTEDDEKNLIDLGTSEVERNRRLENLIAKRIVHKHRIAEARKRNLIDFQSSTYPQIGELLSEEMSRIPIQVTSLSTTKHNPFDPPYDSDEFAGLPPVPGSAPSVLLPRRNPFDLPCDQAHEGSSVMRDKSGYEFMPLQQREICFQRPESLTLGASFPGEIMQERSTGRLQPHSVSEQAASTEMDYASFQMQSTERHDSETISAPKEVSSTREAILRTSGVSMVSMGASVEPSAAEAFIESEEVEKNVDGLSSSSSSETNEKHLKTNAGEVFVGQNPMEIDSPKEFHKSITHVDDVQVKEPVFDSSPSMEKSNSNAGRIAEAQFPSEVEVFSSTSALSDAHVEPVKGDFLPVTVKQSMDVDEANQITSSSETSRLESSKLYRVDENELRPGEITEVSEHDAAEVGFSGVIQNANDSVELLVRIASDVKDDSQDFYSSSLDPLAMEVSVRGRDSHPQLEEAQMLLNSNDEALAVGTQALKVEKTDNVLSTSNGLLLVDDPIPLASQPLVEKTIAQPSHGKSQDDGSNLDKDVHEPDENIDSRFSTLAPRHDGDDLTALHVPEQPNIESSNKLHMISEEILVEKTDARLIDLEENILDQFRTEHLNDSEGANDKLDIDEDAEADGIKELDEGLLSELDAVGDFSVQEPKSNAVEAEMKLQSEPDAVAESLIHLGIKSSLPDLQILQDESGETFGIERSAEPQSVIDLPDSEAGLIQFEMSDRDPNLREHSSELQVLEACSLADIDLAFKKVQEGEVEKSVVSETFTDKSIGLDAEAGPSKMHTEKVDTDLLDNASRLVVPEARSLEDIETAFKQLNEGVHEKFVIEEPLLVKSESASTAALLDTKNEVMDVKFEVGSAESEKPGKGSVLLDTASHICDADAAFKQPHEVVHDESVAVESIVVESEFGSYISSAEEKHLDLPKPENQDIEVGSSNIEATVQEAALIGTVSKLQVLDASSSEDSDSASKGLHEQYFGKSTVYEPQLVESEVGSSVFKFDETHSDSSKLAVMDTELGSSIVKLANGDADLIGTSSEMQGLEARSLADINAAFKQLHEQGLEKGVEVESEYGSSTSTADDKPLGQSILEVKNAEVGNTEVELVKGDSNLKETISELQVLDARSLEDTDSAFKQLHEHDRQKSVEGPQLVESAISLHKTPQDGEHLEHVEVPSDIQVLEAKSLEDIHAVLRPALEEIVESQPKTLVTEVAEIHVEPVAPSQTAEENLEELKESHVSSITEEPSAGKPKNEVRAPESSDSNNKSTSKLPTEATEINVEPVTALQFAEENSVELKESTPAEGSSITEEQSAGKPEDEVRAPESSNPSKSARELEVTEIHVEPFALSQTAEENQVDVRESPVVESSSMAKESSAGKKNEVKASESSDSNKSNSKLASEATERHVEPVAPSQIAEEDQVELRESPVVESSPIAEEPGAGKPKDEVKAPESSDSNKSTSKRKSKKKSGSGSSSSSSSSFSSSDSD